MSAEAGVKVAGKSTPEPGSAGKATTLAGNVNSAGGAASIDGSEALTTAAVTEVVGCCSARRIDNKQDGEPGPIRGGVSGWAWIMAEGAGGVTSATPLAGKAEVEEAGADGITAAVSGKALEVSPPSVLEEGWTGLDRLGDMVVTLQSEVWRVISPSPQGETGTDLHKTS